MNPQIRTLFRVLILVATFGAAIQSDANAKTSRPNVVLFFADDMGYGDLSSFGAPTIQTPKIDALANAGMRLTSFYAAPWCVPSRTQLLLGRYSARVRLGGTSVGGRGGIPDEEVTLAEALNGAGYATGMIGKWHLGYRPERFLPVGQGFDYWYGLPYSNDMRKPWVNTDEPLWLYENSTKIEHPVNQETLTLRYTQKAQAFIEKQSAEKPFFLYFAYSMPHLPVHTAEQFQGQSQGGHYGDVIETIDWSVGQVLDTLKAQGFSENTMVIFTSDNGPWLNLPNRMLQAGNEPWHAGSPGPLRGAKGTTYEGGVRVPCLLKWPGVWTRRGSYPNIASSMDLYTTIINAAGAQGPDHVVDGVDLNPFFSESSDDWPRDDFFYFHGANLQGVRKGPWKLRTQQGLELFHLDRDPSERYNVAEDHPDIVEALTTLARAKVEETGGRLAWNP